mgnify:CR=1 FL=1
MIVTFQDYIDTNVRFPAKLLENDGFTAVIEKANGEKLPVLSDEIRPAKAREILVYRLEKFCRRARS